jgi:hypothetical protein
MRMLDPAFPIPLIDAAVAYRPLDAATGACSVPDETLTVVVTATNRGSPAEVWVTLSLDDDADHASVYYRKSQKITLTESATSVFTYTPDLSDGRRRGIQYAAVDIQDERQVLGYWHSGWRPLFMLADACQQGFQLAIHQ